MTRWPLFVAGVTFAILLPILWIAHAFSGTEPPMSQFGISLTTDRAVYDSGGQPLAATLTLKVSNHTDEAVEFNFTSAQRYDFSIADEQGDELWRWSAERMFAQVMGTEVQEPGEERVYAEVCELTLGPGGYTATGELTATDRPMYASLTFSVR